MSPGLIRDLRDFATGDEDRTQTPQIPHDLEAQLKAFVKGEPAANSGPRHDTPLSASLLEDLKEFAQSGPSLPPSLLEDLKEFARSGPSAPASSTDSEPAPVDLHEEERETSRDSIPDDVFEELRRFAMSDEGAAAPAAAEAPDDDDKGEEAISSALIESLKAFASEGSDDDGRADSPSEPEIIRPGPAHQISEEDREAQRAAFDWKERGSGGRVEMRADPARVGAAEAADAVDRERSETARLRTEQDRRKQTEVDELEAAARAEQEKAEKEEQAAKEEQQSQEAAPEQAQGSAPQGAADGEDGGFADMFAEAFGGGFDEEPSDNADSETTGPAAEPEPDAEAESAAPKETISASADGSTEDRGAESQDGSTGADGESADGESADDAAPESDAEEGSDAGSEDREGASDKDPFESSGDEEKWDSWDFSTDEDDDFEGDDLDEESRLRRELEAEAAKERVAQFTQLMVKAMLRSGYYDPNHPEAQKAKTGLFEQFEYLLKGRHELSFVSMVGRGIQEIFIDGVLEQSFALSKIMMRGMAEMYLPKLCGFFDRKNVMSVTVKVGIGQQKFEAFLDIFSHPVETEEAEENARHLLEEFKEAGITKEIAVVFLDDVVGRGRRLSWRVEMALSRLAKDLRDIPMLKDASAKKIRYLKRQIFEDIVRPLQQAGFVKELLVNLDLIADEFMQRQDLDVYEEFFLNLPEHMVGPLADSITTDVVSYRKDLDDEETPEDKKSLLKGVIANYAHYIVLLSKRLAREPTPEGNKILRHIVEAGLVTVSDLPDDVREFIHIAQMIDEFRDDPSLYIDKFVIVEDEPKYKEMSWVLNRIKLDLVREGNAKVVHEVLELMNVHRSEEVEAFLGRRAIAKESFAMLIDDEIIDELKLRYIKSKRDERTDITAIFESIGGRGVAPLLEMLRATSSSEDQTRHNIIRSLMQLSEESAQAVGAILLKPDLKWNFVRSLLNLLEKIGGQQHTQAVQQQLSHPHPEVRLAAISTFAKLQGKLSESLIEERLMDEKQTVRIRALRTLGSLGSTSGKLLQYIVDHLDKREKGQEEPDLNVQIHACTALSQIGNIVLNEKTGADGTQQETVETFLHHVLRRERAGIFGVGKTPYLTKPSVVRAQVMVALAEVGTELSVPIIEAMTRTTPSALALDIFAKPEADQIDLPRVASDSLRRLESRLSGKGSSPSVPNAEAVETDKDGS